CTVSCITLIMIKLSTKIFLALIVYLIPVELFSQGTELLANTGIIETNADNNYQIVDDISHNRLKINKQNQQDRQLGKRLASGLPYFIVEGGFGLFNSFIKEFEDYYVIRPIVRLGLSVRAYKNAFIYYQISRYPTERRTPESITIEDTMGNLSEDFKEFIQNAGIRFMVRELLPMKNSITWIGTGISALKTENTFITTWTSKEYVDDHFEVEDKRLEIIAPLKKTGFFVEAGHLLQNPSLGIFDFSWGFSFSVKYDYGKTDIKNIGGLTFLLGAHLLKY
ncbi:hypothetical protein ACFL6G_10215, partial [candidate division KSB1 bacterium]